MKALARFFLAGAILAASCGDVAAQTLQQEGSFSVSGVGAQSSGTAQFQIQPYAGSDLSEVILTMTVTRVVETGTWVGLDQTPGVPQATLVDSVGLADFPATSLTVTDAFVGTAPLSNGQTVAYTISSFTPEPASVTVDITTKLPEFEQQNGEAWLPPLLSYSSGIQNDEFGYPSDTNQFRISGTYSLQFIAAPEPNSGWLVLIGVLGMGALFLGRRKARA